MSDLTVHPWKRHGKDRLYVNLPDGTAVAWADRATMTVTIKVRSTRTRLWLFFSVTLERAFCQLHPFASSRAPPCGSFSAAWTSHSRDPETPIRTAGGSPTPQPQ